jgi:hypothetical protein
MTRAELTEEIRGAERAQGLTFTEMELRLGRERSGAAHV